MVSIVPCLAKKYEAARPEFAPEGVRDVDAVLTTTEFLEMVEMLRLEPADITPAEFDEPYKRVTGAGILFGASGGVAEATLRMAVEKLTGEPLLDKLDFEEVRGLRGHQGDDRDRRRRDRARGGGLRPEQHRASRPAHRRR